MQLAFVHPPLILFSPLYLVLNFCIYILSLCFLKRGSWLNTSSMSVICIILIFCPLWLKCDPVVFVCFFLCNIALVLCESLFQHPVSLPDILLGAFTAPRIVRINSNAMSINSEIKRELLLAIKSDISFCQYCAS